MMYEDSINNNSINEDDFLKTIQGIFVFVDKGSSTINLLGNNEGILGIKGLRISTHVEELKDIIDEKYNNMFRGFFTSEENGKVSIVVNIKNKREEHKRLSMQGRHLVGRNGRLVFEGYISELENEEKSTLDVESIDALDRVTGLHNSQFTRERINSFFKKHEEKVHRGAFVILGIDNFKYINDSFGHKCGDEFLYVISNELKKVVKDKYLCRMGGDEFLVFLPDIESLKDAEAKVREIIRVFAKSYIIENNQIFTTTSIGVSIYPDDGINFETLLKNADAAMYIGKMNGKNQYQFFNNNISKELDRVYSIQKGLTTALDKNEMYVVFQPKVMLNKEKVTGFEALIRWQSEELGFVSPAEFIPMAELNEFIVPIGKFVLKEVFQRAKELLEDGYDDFKIAYNLSEVQIREGSIIEYFKKLSEEYKVPGKYIEIEITESMIIKSFKRNIDYLLEFKEMGSTIALDDFGTGYSSLNHLTKLPIDVLKIDRSFVIDMTENHKSRWIIENIIELSHKLGIEVVAEGVEVIEQVDYLKEILCDIVQGYYYSRPESFENAMKMLAK